MDEHDKLDFDGFLVLLSIDTNFWCFKNRPIRNQKISGVNTVYIYKYKSYVNSYGSTYVTIKYGISLNKFDNRIKSSRKPKVIWNWLRTSKIKELTAGEKENSVLFKLNYENT